jgi:hypothetical protein
MFRQTTVLKKANGMVIRTTVYSTEDFDIFVCYPSRFMQNESPQASSSVQLSIFDKRSSAHMLFDAS